VHAQFGGTVIHSRAGLYQMTCVKHLGSDQAFASDNIKTCLFYDMLKRTLAENLQMPGWLKTAPATAVVAKPEAYGLITLKPVGAGGTAKTAITANCAPPSLPRMIN
jgi:hypothetical protein